MRERLTPEIEKDLNNLTEHERSEVVRQLAQDATDAVAALCTHARNSPADFDDSRTRHHIQVLAADLNLLLTTLDGRQELPKTLEELARQQAELNKKTGEL